MTEWLVRAEGLTVGFGTGQPALDDVDMVIRPDQFTGIVGPSGSGKTTLLRAVTGALRPGATPTWRGRLDRAPGLRVGYVPQLETINWDFPITVLECVVLGMPHGGLRGRPTAAERLIARGMLDRLGLQGVADRHIRDLSGGQQQRMFLARALVGEPHLLLLDEPTSGIDITTRHAVLHLLAELNRAGIAIVLTTHDLNGMAAHLPHLVCLNRHVIAQGAPDDVLTTEVLEATFGAGLDVLRHLGMPVVVDAGVRHG